MPVGTCCKSKIEEYFSESVVDNSLQIEKVKEDTSSPLQWCLAREGVTVAVEIRMITIKIRRIGERNRCLDCYIICSHNMNATLEGVSPDCNMESSAAPVSVACMKPPLAWSY